MRPEQYKVDLEKGTTARGSSGRGGKKGSSTRTSKRDNSYQGPPAVIVQHSGHQHEPEGTITSNSSAGGSGAGFMDDHSHKSTGSAGKAMKKQVGKMWKSVTGGSGKNSKKNKQQQQQQQQYGNSDEESLLGGYNSGGVGGGGTFDSQDSPSYATDHPRSDARMQDKWGKIKNHMFHTREETAGTLWFKSQQMGRKMAKGHTNPMDALRDQEQSLADMSRSEIIKEEQDRFEDLMEFSLWQGLLAIVIYVGISVGLFSYWLEDWTIIDSVYFAVVTFTTIGYGDVVPDTRASRMFTCFWALSGVACLGIALGVVGSNLVEVAEQEQKKRTDKQKNEVFDMFNNDSDTNKDSTRKNSGDSTTASQLSDLPTYGAEEYGQRQRNQYNDDDESDTDADCSAKSCLSSPKTQRFVLLSLFLILILYGISITEDWTIPSTMYYGIITASTVGYGDLSPVTERGRVLAILYIPVAVSVMATLLDVVANSIIAQRQQYAQDYLQNKELTLRDLAAMDEDGDGTVTRAEFLGFMLVAMNQIDKDLVKQLNEHFDRLDKDKSGTLDKRDLLEIGHQKLESERQLKQSRRQLV